MDRSIKIECDSGDSFCIDFYHSRFGAIISIFDSNDPDEVMDVQLSYPKLEILRHWVGDVLWAEYERRNSPEAKAKWRQVMNDAGANIPESTDSDGETE